ncbi:hypothetical protein HPB51_014758 [Rhipicephalus microplus]|uniref:Uncharacterized protein n=1 Tax=Rhipicephalus microplus TaxID=6941 RepID=A0A9J6DMN5_RHIMP|nr:hypothetical protein HPB51_014758 [Rhipicephalus microplus]
MRAVANGHRCGGASSLSVGWLAREMFVLGGHSITLLRLWPRWEIIRGKTRNVSSFLRRCCQVRFVVLTRRGVTTTDDRREVKGGNVRSRQTGGKKEAATHLGKAGPSKGVVSPPRDLLGKRDRGAKPFLRNRAPACPLQTTQQHVVVCSWTRRVRLPGDLLRKRRRWRRIQRPAAPLSSPVTGGMRQRLVVSPLAVGFTEGFKMVCHRKEASADGVVTAGASRVLRVSGFGREEKPASCLSLSLDSPSGGPPEVARCAAQDLWREQHCAAAVIGSRAPPRRDAEKRR